MGSLVDVFFIYRTENLFLYYNNNIYEYIELYGTYLYLNNTCQVMFCNSEFVMVLFIPQSLGLHTSNFKPVTLHPLGQDSFLSVKIFSLSQLSKIYHLSDQWEEQVNLESLDNSGWKQINLGPNPIHGVYLFIHFQIALPHV